MGQKTVAVIPARYQSTRLPGKPLIELGGKTIIQRVYEKVQEAKLVDEVIIATDDQRIFEHAQSFNAQVEMTGEDHQSGTDRIAELANKHPEWSVIINVQGDEPFLEPKNIDKAIEPFRYDPLIEMTSLYCEIKEQEEIDNPNVVKVVTDIDDTAMYFSRSAIPYKRDPNQENLTYKKHIGLYGYRRDTLLSLSKLSPTELEQSEKLEQLRALENQIKIKMIKVESTSIGIDTQEDLKKAEALLAN